MGRLCTADVKESRSNNREGVSCQRTVVFAREEVVTDGRGTGCFAVSAAGRRCHVHGGLGHAVGVDVATVRLQ